VIGGAEGPGPGENPARDPNAETNEVLLDPRVLARKGGERQASLRDGPKAEPDRTFIRFELGGERYAVPLESVTKIERVPAIIPVPRTPSFIRGIASLRGEIVTVVDLCTVLGQPPVTSIPHGLLVLSDGGRRVGILSDVLPDYFRIATTALSPAPSAGRGEGLVQNAIERDDGIIAVLDVKKLMDVLARRADG
jgi:purine-binding chemotaxis protein CheW